MLFLAHKYELKLYKVYNLFTNLLRKNQYMQLQVYAQNGQIYKLIPHES